MTPKQKQDRKELLAKNKWLRNVENEFKLQRKRFAKKVRISKKNNKYYANKFVLIHSFDSFDKKVTLCGIVLSKNKVKVTNIESKINCVKCKFDVLK